jgi:hypothetical protein
MAVLLGTLAILEIGLFTSASALAWLGVIDT